jgi:endonuclease/exonuclease/phosphatase family metal-dependent hydrolase
MSAQFSILTYNVGNGRASPARLVRMLRDSGADIVALQELSDVQAEEIERDLPDLFPYRALFPGGFAGKGILSRYPIGRAEQLHLSQQRPDLLVALHLNRPLTVISAHPPPPRPSPLKLSFDQDTLAEIKSLAALARENAPAILLGDFNMTDTNPEYASIASAGLQDAFRASGRGRGNTLPRRIGPWRRNRWLNGLIRWVPLVPLVRIDFIWHTAQLESLECRVGQDAGSDHLPVLAVMRFTATVGASAS